jgi:alpha-galactosidase
LSSLDLGRATSGWGIAVANASVTTTKLSIAGATFENGVGVHARSVMHIALNGVATRFHAMCGVDDNAKNKRGSVIFRIHGDGKKLWQSPLMHGGDVAVPVNIDVSALKNLTLIVTDGGDGKDFDHADWADAKFDFTGAKPQLIAAPVEEQVLLTPLPQPSPQINGPKIYGARPGHPFLKRIPCTGERPMKFSAKNLPAGLSLDEKTGIITGTTPAKGEYAITLVAENSKGKCERAFKLVAGDTLSLTPQMGYNHWYAHYNRISEAMMREAADLLISTGMADAGYEFVNVDDCWMNAPGTSKYQTDPKRVGPVRDANSNTVPNAYFPDMKGLADYIHSKGLKAGLYTSPGPRTCAGFGGAYKHEAEDAKLFADWGFDFLKYDWCSYGGVAGKKPSLDDMKKPYQLMGDLLKQQNRDIVFNLCQYGMGDVWKWGKDVGGHSWRTAGDLGFELHRILDIALKNSEIGAFNGPGGWNDPDYLQIGWIGSQRGGGFEMPKPCPLTPSEQYSFMSLWCLLPAPLFYSGDMPHLDAFTLNILCNPEIIDVNQDALGKSASVVKLEDDAFLMIKDLEDGSKAVGLCNRGEVEMEVAAKWSDLGVTGKQSVRDLWRQKDLGDFDGQFSTVVPRHGVAVIKVKAAK